MIELNESTQLGANQAEGTTLLLPTDREQTLRIQASQQVIASLIADYHPNHNDVLGNRYIQRNRLIGGVEATLEKDPFLIKQGVFKVGIQHFLDPDQNTLGQAYGMPDSDIVYIQGYYNNGSLQQEVDQAIVDNPNLRNSLITSFLLNRSDDPTAERIKKISSFRMVQEESPVTPEDLATLVTNITEVESRLLEDYSVNGQTEGVKPSEVSPKQPERWQNRAFGVVFRAHKLITG